MNLTQAEDQARIYLIEGRDEQAYQLLQQMIEADASYENAYYLLSIIARKYQNYPKELELLKKAQTLGGQRLAYQIYTARALAMSGETDVAKQQLDAANKQNIDSAELIDAIASTYNKLHLYQEACDWFARLIEFDQSNPYAFFNLGTCYKFCGRFAEAQKAFAQAIALKPDYYKAYAALSSFTQPSQSSYRIDKLNSLLGQAPTLDAQLHLSHALSKEYDAVQDYQQSFASLINIKHKMKTQLKYQFTEDETLFRQINLALDNQPKDAQGAVLRSNEVSDIFVVGMPRTGTTLVERILSGHAQVKSGGELYHFNLALKKRLAVNDQRFASVECFSRFNSLVAKEIGQDYKRLTSYLCDPKDVLLNKLPLNILYAWQILDALPDAVIVCLDRHPLDTIVGNFRQLFSFDDRANLYTLDLLDSARYYAQFNQLMHKLQQRFAQRFYVVKYEELVNQPAQQAEALYQFCGLHWDNQYLAIENNKQPVATASSVQVRQKIHKKAIAQWERYSTFLDEAKNTLSANNIPF